MRWVVALLLVLGGCSSWETWGIHAEVSACPGEEGDGDHEGEEDGTRYTVSETHDEISDDGIHLIASYDEQTNAFRGTAQNTTLVTLCEVRVEVHLGDGSEIGPTAALDLEPDETLEFSLAEADAREGEEGHEAGGDQD